MRVPLLRPWQVCLLAAFFSLAGSALASLWIRRHIPLVHDEFAYLLQAETFASGRLTNPPHPLAPFFEAPHVLDRPTYNAKYPPGHALFLAAGMLCGAPIFGVWLENAAFAAALAWMLLVFLPPRWALLGAALAVLQLGLLNYWAQTYWVASLAAAGGALVWGGTFAVTGRRRPADGWLLGLGAACLMVSRPFEGALACVVPAGVLLHRWLRAQAPGARSRLWREGLAPAVLATTAAIVALAVYNRAVTGDPLRLPYSAYERLHSGAPLFAWQPEAPAVPPAFSAPALEAFHERFVLPMSRVDTLSWSAWLLRLRETAVSNLGWVLCVLALAGALPGFVRRGPAWGRLATLSLGFCSLGFLASVWFDVHYYLPMLPPVVLLATHALRRARGLFSRGRLPLAWIALPALAAVSLGLVLNRQFERSPAYYNRAVPPRQKIIDALSVQPQRFLVIVRHEEPFDLHKTYVANAADIDRAKIVWAWDRGDAENRRLLAYYPDREAVLMRVSARSLAFSAYPRTTPP